MDVVERLLNYRLNQGEPKDSFVVIATARKRGEALREEHHKVVTRLDTPEIGNVLPVALRLRHYLLNRETPQT